MSAATRFPSSINLLNLSIASNELRDIRWTISLILLVTNCNRTKFKVVYFCHFASFPDNSPVKYPPSSDGFSQCNLPLNTELLPEHLHILLGVH
jgi:hypothetical protein